MRTLLLPSLLFLLGCANPGTNDTQSLPDDLPTPKVPVPRSEEATAELARALCAAIDAKDLAAVRAAIAAGANLETGVGAGEGDTKDRTPLIHAVLAGEQPVLDALLDAGARLDGDDEGGHTALMYAALTGQAGLARHLLARGARADAKDDQDSTAADYAGKDQDLAALLVQAADGNRAVLAAADATAVLAAIAAGGSPNSNDGTHCPLRRAIDAGDRAFVQQLLQAGARADLWLPDGFLVDSPLAIAARTAPLPILSDLLASPCSAPARHDALVAAAESELPDRAERVRLLLAAGADPNQPQDIGTPALARAAEHGDLDAMVQLLRAGADQDQVNHALMAAPQAPRERSVPTVRLLDRVGADPDWSLFLGTALGTAAKAGNDHLMRDLLTRSNDRTLNLAILETTLDGKAESLRLLLHLGGKRVDLAFRDGLFEPALVLAAQKGLLDCARVLLAAGADPNQDASGLLAMSPLIAAVRSDRLEVLELLLAAGADPARPYKGGLDQESAIDVARDLGKDDALAILQRRR